MFYLPLMKKYVLPLGHVLPIIVTKNIFYHPSLADNNLLTVTYLAMPCRLSPLPNCNEWEAN